jgi:hypothetical protein
METSAPTVFLGGREVIATGLIVVPPDETVEIIPPPNSRLPLRLQVSFERDESGGSRMEANAEGKQVTLRLFNFFNPNGVATVKPLAIGATEGRVLFLTYMVHVVGAKDAATRLFSYTLSLAPAF